MANNAKTIMLKDTNLSKIYKVINTLQTTNTYTVVENDPIFKGGSIVKIGTVITRGDSWAFDVKEFEQVKDAADKIYYVAVNFCGDIANA